MSVMSSAKSITSASPMAALPAGASGSNFGGGWSGKSLNQDYLRILAAYGPPGRSMRHLGAAVDADFNTY